VYTSVREMLAGWTRIFWGALRPRRRLVLASVALLIMGLVPYFAFGAAVLAGAAEARGRLAAALASGLAILLQLSVVWRVSTVPAASRCCSGRGLSAAHLPC
jgi:hypothetical protein